MTNAKMTKKDCLNALINHLNLDTTVVDNKDDLVKFCLNEIDLLDKKAAKAKDKAAAKKNTIDALTAAVLDVLDGFDTPATINELVAAVSDQFPDVTNAKISARLSPLVKSGELKKEDITVARESGKSKLVAYTRV